MQPTPQGLSCSIFQYDIHHQHSAWPGPVSLVLYDALGRERHSLVKSRQAAGRHSVAIDGAGLQSGVYFCRVESGHSSATRQLTVIR